MLIGCPVVFGLSLCIQGTLFKNSPHSNLSRFIPVHTGNIISPIVSAWIQSVYPCAYREHLFGIGCISFGFGLSLCIQGTCPLVSLLQIYRPVYPCAYREHIVKKLFSDSIIGLSLCIQGTSRTSKRYVGWLRFIPVHTGNMPPPEFISRTISVYPCAYREHQPRRQY